MKQLFFVMLATEFTLECSSLVLNTVPVKSGFQMDPFFREEFKEGKRNSAGSFVKKNGGFEYSGNWIDGLMEVEGILYNKAPLSSSIETRQNEEK